ncbi:Fc.00g033580.m01.CDS01 [Cosmosporella sp. VM-42]
MACGCCGPPKQAPEPAAPQIELQNGDSSCDATPVPLSGTEPVQVEAANTLDCTEVCCEMGKCCEEGKSTDSCQEFITEEPANGCQDGCCVDDKPAVAKVEEVTSTITTKTPSGCCDSKRDVDTLKAELDETPACCQDKPGPCCDVSCLDRLALRECDVNCSATDDGDSLKRPATSSQSSTACFGAVDGKACGRHRRSTRDRYGATLEALGCICRALLARGLESCCEPRQLSSIERNRCSKRSSPRTSLDSCCATGSWTETSMPNGRKKSRGSNRSCSKGVRGATFSSASLDTPELTKPPCTDACCSSKKAPMLGTNLSKATMAKKPCADGCCSPKEPDILVASLPKAEVAKKLCADGCCSSEKPSFVPTVKAKPSTAAINDLERQATGTEHVILSISGMTCTGCETKLNRTLANVSAVKNLKTSLILSRAEFDLDLCAASVEDVVKHLERTTEFKCEKIADQGSNLDVVVAGDLSSFIDQDWPAGVIDMAAVDNQVVRITFDPKILGARDLVEEGWGHPQTLAPPRADPSLEAGSKHVRQLGYLTLLSAVLTIPVLVLAWAPLPEREIAYSSASLALATIVQVVIAGPFYPKAIKALVFSKVIEMDLLIVLSTSAAYIFSVVAYGFLVSGKPLDREQFFETSTLLVTLIMVGRYVAALARQKAVESISIRSLQTSNAILLDESSGSEREVDVRLLQYGDAFKVVPDTSIPTDGTVVVGSSEVDESMLTGESQPVEKHPKSSVIAGSINGSGTLIIRLTRLLGDNTINTIASMVDEAKLSKPKMQGLADRVASYFVPVVVTLTIITFSIWIAVGVAVRKQSASHATVDAITYAITVLIVSCPCAIGLAVPMVVVIASGVAANRGVVFKTAGAIEVAYKASHVVFDKTGTLTQGKLAVLETWYASDESDPSLSLLLGLVSNIPHPVSVAVASHLKVKGFEAANVSEPRSLTGKGVEATVGGKILRAGNSRWLDLSSHPAVQSILAQGYTAFCFVVDDALQAVYGLGDSIRPDAIDIVSKLQGHGISVHIVSGDDDAAVQSVAAELSVSEAKVRSRCSPADKQAYIQRLLESTAATGKKPVVVFCGDGTNDAVALAQATIGVHMNEGTDVAKSAADVVLMRPDLYGILTMITISRRAVHRIKFNFAWSFIYNLFAVLLAAGAFVHASIPPQFAGLGELVSVLPVIAAAVLLRWSNV